LDSRAIGVDRHLATESIDLPDDLALGLPADGRVAAHLGYRVDVASQQEGGGSHAGGRERRLDAGMSGAANDYVITLIIGVQALK
jgi:hypothetical protein